MRGTSQQRVTSGNKQRAAVIECCNSRVCRAHVSHESWLSSKEVFPIGTEWILDSTICRLMHSAHSHIAYEAYETRRPWLDPTTTNQLVYKWFTGYALTSYYGCIYYCFLILFSLLLDACMYTL
jgi:hypothetical protein